MAEKVTIITVSYNSEKTIEDTFLSVLNQSFRPLEYVLVDGGSTDRTMDIVQKYISVFKENGIDNVRLIDFEYAGMQDQDVDIAMFCIYSMFDRKQIDNLIDIYYEENCKPNIRIKIYCYIAACGLLWSNWCEYKKILGIEFGEYSLKQYRYAKEYYKIAINEMEKLKWIK